jgi:hypothetical protein
MYLICTEGMTEKAHFENYRSSTGPIILALDKSDQKLGLVEKTIKERKRRTQEGEFDDQIDETWVVLDRDANPSNKQDKIHFTKALDLAKRNGIRVAYSNDAFELWYVLHYQDLWAHTHRDALNGKLSQHIGRKYRKGADTDLYHDIKHLRAIAIRRAEKLSKTDKHPADANPSTTVHLLVKALMNEPGYRE